MSTSIFKLGVTKDRELCFGLILGGYIDCLPYYRFGLICCHSIILIPSYCTHFRCFTSYHVSGCMHLGPYVNSLALILNNTGVQDEIKSVSLLHIMLCSQTKRGSCRHFILQPYFTFTIRICPSHWRIKSWRRLKSIISTIGFNPIQHTETNSSNYVYITEL